MCKKSKVDGLIVVDLPYPENKNFASKCKKKNINFIQLGFTNNIKRQIEAENHKVILMI